MFMKCFITGGTGFVGRNLSNSLLREGHVVVAVGLRPKQDIIQHEAFDYISADTSQEGSWQDAVNEADVVFNLAGKSIFKRWTESYKQQIYDSRILTTRNLVDALPENKEITFCSASAVGYYGNRGDETLTESSRCGDDFLAKVGVDWEGEAFRAEEKGIRVVAPRFGIVLGKGGGAMAKMVPAFKFFLGGPLGTGSQWFPWIHLDDLISGLMFVIENKVIKESVNFTSPNPVRNRDLAKTLGKVLGRPALMPTPGFMIRLVMGEFGNTLLASQRAIPDTLQKQGFKFRFEALEDALRDIVAEGYSKNNPETFICTECGEQHCTCHKRQESS
jgi:uncharacterized protein (TIGR01777 family)